MSAIEARDLTKIYRTYRKESGLWGAIKGLGRRQLRRNASSGRCFISNRGRRISSDFSDPNGAGKTTVLKMLSGLLNPTGGDARVLGFVPWERRNEMKRQFSLLMGQKNALWWDLPAQESLEAEPRDLWNRSRSFQQSGRRVGRTVRSHRQNERDGGASFHSVSE